MKKVTFEISNTGLNLEDTPTWYMHWLTSMDRDDAVTVNETMNSLVEQGDIWFISDNITNDGSGFSMTIIFDSEDALTNWKAVQSIFEKMFAIAGETPNFTEADLTFEEFATFASENEETAFTGLPEDF